MFVFKLPEGRNAFDGDDDDDNDDADYDDDDDDDDTSRPWVADVYKDNDENL